MTLSIANRRESNHQHSEHSAAVQTLFRPEVVAERQTQSLGSVLLEPKLSHKAFSLSALVALAAIFTLLIFGSYTRKARVNGWLVPDSGLIKVFAPQNGVVTNLSAREGERVAKNTALMTISAEVRSEAFGETRRNVLEQIRLRRHTLTAEHRNQDVLFAEQAIDLRRRIEMAHTELDHLTREIQILRNRLSLANRTVARQRSLAARQLLALTRLEQSEQEALDLAARKEALERDRVARQGQLEQSEAALRQLSSQHETRVSQIIQSQAALDQELAEAEAHRQVLIVAPHEGIVSGIQAEEGGAITTNAPLLNILPLGAKLEAQIFASSHVVGFLRTGQHVLLRYKSFPFQQFGSYAGAVTDVSRSAVSPAELPQALAGLTSLSGTNEPVYRITVALDRQSVTAYGERIPLKPGMQLEADILIEKRRLFEWILDPLYTITGK